jgi:IS605 OrfB family transposase
MRGGWAGWRWPPTIRGTSWSAIQHLVDASWGQFVSILRAKAEDAGRTWIEVDPQHTSDRPRE